MAAAIDLRDDFDGRGLRALAKSAKDAAQVRRLLALAAIYDGGSRTDAARISGVGLQTVRALRQAQEGAALQRRLTGWARQRQGAGPSAEAQRCAAPGPGGDRGERADPGCPRSGALAAGRSGAVGLGGVPALLERDHGEPGAEGARFPQAVGAAAPLCAKRGGGGGF